MDYLMFIGSILSDELCPFWTNNEPQNLFLHYFLNNNLSFKNKATTWMQLHQNMWIDSESTTISYSFFVPLHLILTFCFLFHNAEKDRTGWILNNSIHEHSQEFEMAVWSLHIKAPCYLLLLRFQTESFLFLRRFEEWLICVNTRICMRTRLLLYKQERSLFLCLKGYTNPISELGGYPVT